MISGHPHPLWVVIVLGLLAACVPSPTATPPRQPPFPTLPLTGKTATPDPRATRAPNQPTGLPGQSPVPTFPPPTVAHTGAGAALALDTMPPLVQLTVQDPQTPVSIGQPVALNVLAADNSFVVRLDLFDNGALVMQAPAILPAPVYSNQFVWKANGPGTHTLRAVAYDAAGNASEPTQIQLAVINNNRAPAVQITSPSGSKNAELGAPVLIQGVATDDVAVTRMDLIVDNELVTFATPDNPEGVTPFAVALPWTPMTTGAHNIVLRAYDNQGQTDDSLRYTVRVFDNQPPVVTASTEDTTLAAGDALVVHALALSNNGISHLELYVDGLVATSAVSHLGAQQTAFDTLLAAADLIEGTHEFFVRAYDVTGQSSDSARTRFTTSSTVPLVHLEEPAPPTTNAPPPALPTPTPTLVLPDPPIVNVRLTNDSPRVNLPGPISIQIAASGSTELDHIELWLRNPGEEVGQALLDENVQGATERVVSFDWNPTRAGVFELLARVTDNVGQARWSQPLRVEVRVPPAPTPAPEVFNFAQTWLAESPASRFEATFVQIGKALRGTLVEKRADGTSLTGKIVSGAVTENAARFGVDLTEDVTTPQHTLTFECSFTPRPPKLTCNYTDEQGHRGSAIFTPLVKP